MKSHTHNQQALKQAAEWFVLLASGEASKDDHCRWHAWRRAHPGNESAWQRAAATANRFASLPRDLAPASLAALQSAGPPQSGHRRKHIMQCAALLGSCLLGWRGYRQSDWSADAVTAVGEQRNLQLADGSKLRLDTDSALDIAFSEKFRLLRLRRGQVMVETAPDPQPDHRPFIVETADGRILALGTRFTVRQEAEATRVNVLEARVALQANDAATPPPLLVAGQSARFNRRGLLEQTLLQASATAWIKGQLIADEMRLDHFVAELGRYRQAPLRCAASAAGLRISGAFPLAESERALRAVAETLPIRLQQESDGGITIVSKK